MSISTNPLRRLSDDIALAGISDAPQAFKWVKSDNLTQDTATKFQMAQEAQLHIDRVNCLLVRPINSPSEVVQLNTDVVTLYQDLAGSVTVRKSGRRHNNKKKWFDINCRIAKRQANRADRNANNNPYSTFLREQHFLKKKEYRTIKRRKKHAFLHEMNNKINGADTINWSALKQLSANYRDEEPFDIYDLILFQKFFSDLYNRQCCKDHPSIIDNDVRSQHSREHDLLHALNEDFTLEELTNRKNSKSGGVCIGVHKSLTNGVINVPVTSSDDIIAIKLKACFFDLDRDTYLINVYDSPKNGAFKKRQRTTLGEDEVTTLEHLQEFLANIPINEDAILLGDFNARTATLEDMLSDNVRLNDKQLHEYFVRELPKRSNSDTKLNSNGRPFTELLQTSGLVFLNGRTLGDIFGEPTCIQRQGASTVDYICVSASLYHRVRHFRVNGISQYSDHRSLSMSISTNPLRRLSDDIALAGISDAPQAFKWVKSDNLTQDTATKFQMAQEAQLHIDRVNCLLVRPINSPSEVVQLNTDVVTLYQDLAGSVTVRKSGRRHNNKKKWFDINCRIAKRQANRADRNANNNPYSTFLREQHFLKKKEYRTIKRRKKHAFLHEMNNKINGADTINWSALKQLSANYRDEEPFDIYDLILFQKFFSDLYNRQCCKDHPSIIDNDVRSQHSREHDLLHALNEDFTLEELTVTIKKLQNKKSVAEDLICNEMLKNSNKHLLELLQKLFNACLNHAL
ncbi:hypothetical protein ACHWQZ_G002136 [Mnemiopsis leidyi]